jgi:hypothetical protein
MATWAEIREGNRRQQKLREIARKTRKKTGKPYVKITMHPVPLEHPKSKRRAKSIAHPVSARASNDRRVGRVSDEYVKPKAKSLAHPVSTRNRDDRQVGRVSDEHTGFNKGIGKPVAPSAARAALGFNTGYPTGSGSPGSNKAYRQAPAKAAGLVTKSSGNPVPLAKLTPPTIGGKIKAALAGSRQQQKIKALQRQHRAARAGTSAQVRTLTHR